MGRTAYQARALELCGSRKILDIVKDISRQLELAPPNGLNNHKRALAENSMREIQKYYDAHTSHQIETLAELESRDSKYFDDVSWKIIHALDAGARI
jgi:hypothetical protein